MQVKKKGAPTRYPFTSMDVGDSVQIIFETRRIQSYVHSYAAQSGKKFSTKTINKVMTVTRIA